ncbi:MAG TPA: histidinol-phosphate transaminase [Blastocatellia bacterium]|nr:histidinol-phosphate transaminase [Blastocatellia bacterium]
MESVSIVMAVHNGAAYLERSLGAIMNSAGPDTEVIVVDDCSSDDSRAIASRFPCRLIPLSERGGPGRARNLGVASSSREIIFFTDADVVITPGLLDRITSFMGENRDVSAVIGAYTERAGEENFVSAYKNLLHHYVHHRSRGRVASFFTACGAIRRAAFDEMGGFIETHRNCALEDVELGMRLYKHGKSVELLPELQVSHLKRYSILGLVRADLWQRAVPYTVHMLRHRVFPNELSVSSADRASVVLVYLSLLLSSISPLAASPLPLLSAALLAACSYLYLHKGFYGFLANRKGRAFACKAIPLQALTYFYSGLGLGIGILAYYFSRERQGPSREPRAEPAGAAGRGRHHLRPNPNIMGVIPHQPAKPDAGLARLAFNENPAGPSPLSLEAVRQALSTLHRYPDSRGTELKEALAHKHGVRSDNLILGQGASEVLELIARAFICPGDEVIFPDPTFPWYRLLGQLNAADNISVPLKNHTVDLTALAERVSHRTKLVFIANPNNPTGTVVERREIEQYLNRLPANVITVFDEAYIDYAVGKEVDSVKHIESKPVIVVRTFSKVMGLAGIRIGYGVASREIIEIVSKVRRPYNTCSLAQAAAVASLNDRSHMERTLKIVGEGKEFFYSQFKRLGLDYVPSEANFILVDVGRDGAEVSQALASRGFLIRPALQNCIRISIGTREQNASLINALEDLLPKRWGPLHAAASSVAAAWPGSYAGMKPPPAI